MHTRREQLTPAHMMRKKTTEAIVEKVNHLRDALKYILLSLPSPTEKPPSQERDEIIREAYATGNYRSPGVRLAQFDASRRACHIVADGRGSWLSCCDQPSCFFE